MVEKLKGKYVKVLVSSGSGAGVGGEASRYFNSMITVFGTIKDATGKFVELENTTTLYYSGVGCTYDKLAMMTSDNLKQPSAFENKTTLLNANNIIMISVVE